MKRAIATAAIVMVALPAQAHTTGEIKAWEAEWNQHVKAEGLTPELLEQRLDFMARHTSHYNPKPLAVVSSTTYRGIGAGVERWRGLVAAHFPADQVNTALCVMSGESGGNPNARNPSSGAAGLFQVMPFWWDHYGGDRYDPTRNVEVARLVWDQQGWSGWAVYNRGLC